MKECVIVDKSKAFALRIIKLYRYLCAEKQEYVLSKQLLRSGTSIGANVREAKRAQSKPDFYLKMNIALKEADEAAYWLELLHESEFLEPQAFGVRRSNRVNGNNIHKQSGGKILWQTETRFGRKGNGACKASHGGLQKHRRHSGKT